MLCVMERMLGFNGLKSDISELKSTCESISRQIRGWANSLQNSDIEGPRHLNDQSKALYDSRKRKEALEEEHRRWKVDFEAKLQAEVAARHMQQAATQAPLPSEETEHPKSEI